MADITAVALYLHYWKLFKPVPQWLLALIALAVVFALNMMSVKMFGEAEFWFAAIKVATIIGFMLIAIGAIIFHAIPALRLMAHTPRACIILRSLAASCLTVFLLCSPLTLGVVYAFGGTEMVGVAAGETQDAQKVLPKAINSMIVRIFVFYIGSVLLMALVLPYMAYSSDESPFVTFFSGINVPYAGDIIQVVVLTAALSS